MSLPAIYWLQMVLSTRVIVNGGGGGGGGGQLAR